MINLFVSNYHIKGITSKIGRNLTFLGSNRNQITANARDYQKIKGSLEFCHHFLNLVDQKYVLSRSYESLFNEERAVFPDLSSNSTILIPVLSGAITSLTGAITEPNMDDLNQAAATTILTALVKAMTDLETNFPEAAPSFVTIFSEIRALRASLPIFSDTEIERINALTDELGQQMIVAEIPQEDRLIYRAQISAAYEEILTGVRSDITKISDALKTATTDQENDNQIKALLTALFNYFANLSFLGFTSTSLGYGEAGDTIGLISSLFRVLSQVSSDKQKLVDTPINALMNSSLMNGTTPVEVYKVLAELYCFYLAGQLSASNAVLTVADVNTAIAKVIAGFNTGLTIEANFKQSMQNVINLNGQSSLLAGKSLYKANNDDGIDLDFSYLQAIVTSTSGTAGIINSMADARKTSNANEFAIFLGKWQQILNNDALDLQNLQTASKALEAYNAKVGAQVLDAYAFQMKELPLPSAVAFILLDRYMPQEVEYLETLTNTLYYNNIGSKIGNAVLDGIITFVNAASYFNFASYTGKQPVIGVPGFPGDLARAKQKLIAEKEKAISYIAECDAAQKIILDQMKLIDDDTVLDSFQKKTLYANLYKYQDALTSISAGLTSLALLLGQLSIQPAVDSQNITVEGMFRVSGPSNWQPQLEDLETVVVSGIVGSPIVSGTFSSQAVIQSDQQGFADEGQNNQLDLQMHLTSMQQEWTVVATSLQILNQIYLGIARNILG